MEGCVAIYSDLGASFQCLVITSARADSACSDLRPISWKYIVRPRLLTDEAVNKMMCCCCGKPNLCFSFLRRFRSNEPIYLAKNRFQTNLDSKHLFVVIFTLIPFKLENYTIEKIIIETLKTTSVKVTTNKCFESKFVWNRIFAKYIGSLERNRRKKEKHKLSVPQKQRISLLTTSSVGVAYF